jgi:hypothetical protein
MMKKMMRATFERVVQKKYQTFDEIALNFKECKIKFKFSVYLHWRKIDDCYNRPADAVNSV